MAWIFEHLSAHDKFCEQSTVGDKPVERSRVCFKVQFPTVLGCLERQKLVRIAFT